MVYSWTACMFQILIIQQRTAEITTTATLWLTQPIMSDPTKWLHPALMTFIKGYTNFQKQCPSQGSRAQSAGWPCKLDKLPLHHGPETAGVWENPCRVSFRLQENHSAELLQESSPSPLLTHTANAAKPSPPSTGPGPACQTMQTCHSGVYA